MDTAVLIVATPLVVLYLVELVLCFISYGREKKYYESKKDNQTL